MTLRSIVGRTLLAATLAAGTTGAFADVVIGPTAVKTTLPGFPAQTPPNSLIDQNGLSSTYVSGTTDFATYVASTTHATQRFSPPNFWATGLNFSGGNNLGTPVSFDLGASTSINGIAIWNMVEANFSVTSVSLYADTDDNLTNGLGTLIGTSLPVSVFASAASNLATVIPFSAISTRYVVVTLDAANGAPTGAGLAEVAFSGVSAVTPVPEPGTWALMLAGLGVVGWVARRSRTTAPTEA